MSSRLTAGRTPSVSVSFYIYTMRSLASKCAGRLGRPLAHGLALLVNLTSSINFPHTARLKITLLARMSLTIYALLLLYLWRYSRPTLLASIPQRADLGNWHTQHERVIDPNRPPLSYEDWQLDLTESISFLYRIVRPYSDT